jgi:iron complex outermembrane receptor protein
MGRLLSKDVLRVTMRSALGVAILGGVYATPAFAQSTEPPSERQSATTLPEVRVAGQRARPRRAARVAPAPVPAQPVPAQVGERGTGPVVGYSARQSVTATKTDTPLLETPQSISVVTKDQIKDQGAQTVQDALQYTPGVALQSYGANAFFDGFKLRGFDAPQYLDGLRMPRDGVQFAMPKIETYGLERLEVLKGPSSGLYGQTDPGGFINMISKRPTATPHFEAEGTFGSFNRVQGAFDFGGPIDKNGEFLYRLVGLARQSDTQTDFMQDNKVFIAPSFTWRPTNDTSFTILSHYQKIDNKGYQQYVPGQVSFLPNPNGHVPYSRYIGEPGLDGYKLEQAAIGYAFEHRFDNNLQFRQNLRYMEVSNDLQSVRSEGMVPLNNTLVNRTYNYISSKAENFTVDNQLQADFRTGALTHKVLVGLDYLKQTGSSDYRFAFIAPINAYNPVYGTPVPPASSLTPGMLLNNKIDQVGLYAQDQIKLDRWTLSLTGRQDWVNTQVIASAPPPFGYPPAGTYGRSDAASTGRVGLNYLFDFGLSPYANYSTSFVPNANASQTGQAFKPTTGEGWEVGVKFQPVGTNLMLTAAYFDIQQDNVLTGDPGNPLFSVQTDGVHSTGVELEARGNITREFEIIAGYTHTDARISKSVLGAQGKYVNGVPIDQASLWAKYTWYDGPLAGLGLGAGVRYVGESYGDQFNTFVLPDYTLFDASVNYDFAYMRPDLKGWSAQVTAKNLTNRYYVASCLTGLAYCGLGTARTVLGTLKYSWN